MTRIDSCNSKDKNVVKGTFKGRRQSAERRHVPLYANLRDFNLRRILVPGVETPSGSRNEFVTGVVDTGNSFEFEDQAFCTLTVSTFLGKIRGREILCVWLDAMEIAFHAYTSVSFFFFF